MGRKKGRCLHVGCAVVWYDVRSTQCVSVVVLRAAGSARKAFA